MEYTLEKIMNSEIATQIAVGFATIYLLPIPVLLVMAFIRKFV